MQRHQDQEADTWPAGQTLTLKTTESSYLALDNSPEEEEYNEDENWEATINACMSAFTVDKEPWFLDLGESSHVTGKPSLITEKSKSHVPGIRTATGQILPVAYKGHVSFSTPEVKTLSDILYVPGVKTNLLFVQRLTNLGHNIYFNSYTCFIFDVLHPDMVFLQATRDPKMKLYKL